MAKKKHGKQSDPSAAAKAGAGTAEEAREAASDAPAEAPAGMDAAADAAGREAASAGTDHAAGPNGDAEYPPGDESLEAQLAGAQAEARDAADRALRTLAEFDNFRRRSERQLGQARASGAADVLRDLLDVADNLDRALEHAGEDVPATFVDGMNLVARGLHDLLDRQGVARMQAEGQPFDPERHEALTVMPTDGAPPNTVVQEVQPGYLMGEQVLRPAKVIVSAALPAVDGSGS